MNSYLIKNVRWINSQEGECGYGDVLLEGGRIGRMGGQTGGGTAVEVDGEGCWLLPGVIDDQVHFRDFELSRKGTIGSESRAAVAGGVTSYMEMPNTKPAAVTRAVWAAKLARARRDSRANYAFYIGGTNDNLEGVLALAGDRRVPGLKLFLGSSTGNLLVDDDTALEGFFSRWPRLIATHCEDEGVIRRNLEAARLKYGGRIPMAAHAEIRDVEACITSSRKALALARRHGTRLHVLHVTTEEEAGMFEPGPSTGKKITCEACVHHLTFTAEDYAARGGLIKCNPSIKEERHREALWRALREDRIDVIATDHAPHTREEKAEEDYEVVPAGLPLVQHGLPMMLEAVAAGRLTERDLVRKMCATPAELFGMAERGTLREGWHADAVLVDPRKTTVAREHNMHYGCGWSPLADMELRGRVLCTWVGGQLAYDRGRFDEGVRGVELEFDGAW